MHGSSQKRALYYSGNYRHCVLIPTALTVFYLHKLLSLFQFLRCPCIHDVHKFRLQGSTADQKAVNVWLRSYTKTSQFLEDSEG